LDASPFDQVWRACLKNSIDLVYFRLKVKAV
jgi:hypothetical protein